MNQHARHPEILLRLKRASGHLTKVIAMIEAEESCERVAQQLQAVTSALLTAKRNYVTDHIEIIDLGSANGIELNGSLISREVVRPADVIRIGDTTLRRPLIAQQSGELHLQLDSLAR